MSLLNSLQRNFLNSYATIVFAFAICHLPIRFSELANTPHSPQANALAGQWRMRRLCHFVKAKWQMVYLSDFQSVNFVVFGEVSPQQSIAQMENKGQEDSYSHFFPRRCCYFFDSVVVQKSH